MKVAVIFPGQGSQFVGMGKDLADNFKEAKFLFDEADSIVGDNLSQVCFSGPEEKLKDTLYQQIAIFLVSAASWQVLKTRMECACSFFAGLSLGEYTCLYASEVLSFSDTLKLIKERAQLMRQAAKNNPSCMLAVLGLNKQDIQEQDTKLFYIANLNCPQQVVISLTKDNMRRTQQYLESKGAKKIVELQVSGGFHSPFMKEAESKLSECIYSLTFHDAKTPIVSNVDGAPHTSRDEIETNLILQLTKPVLWSKSIDFMKQEGINLFYEVGPSKILKGILRKIDSSLEVINFGSHQDFSRLELS